MNRPSARLEPDEDFSARFTTAEFLGMSQLDVFDDMKVELVDGELERRNSPQSAHAKWQMRIGVRHSAIAGGDFVLGEVGIDLGRNTVLGCDVALLRAPMADNRWLKPPEIVLVIEVAQTAMPRDMGMKRLGYAVASIPH